MKAVDLKNAGYRVGLQVSDEDVANAEAIVTQSYIVPITKDNGTSENYTAAKMALVFIALTTANVYATRAGGKTKLSPQLSERGGASQLDYENADRELRKLQASNVNFTQGRLDGIVDDVLHVYFRSYLSM